jgi:nucleoside-diphosphate-sugar epimerase
LSILVTGGSGFLGRAFVQKMLEKGETVYCVYRHVMPEQEKLKCLIGDILEPDLGLKFIPRGVNSLYHLAGTVNLGSDRNGNIFKTNYQGTINVTTFCREHHIDHLFYVSSAYSKFQRNPYERSKRAAEIAVTDSKIPLITIFKPSIIVSVDDSVRGEHIPTFASLMMRTNHRAEIVRRKIEGTLHLPVLEPVFHFRGNPDGELNVISLDDVTSAMATIIEPGIFTLSNPNPPNVQEVASAIGEFILLKVLVVSEFNETPIEYVFARLTNAFSPYLYGNHLDSDLKECAKVDASFIHKMLEKTLL